MTTSSYWADTTVTLNVITRKFANVSGLLQFVILLVIYFGDLEVSVLASGTRVRGFKPGRSRRIFRAKKILSTPSFGGEVKPSVPRRKFTAFNRNRKWGGSRHFRQNSQPFLAHSSTFRCWGSLASFQTGGGSLNVLITGPPGWGFDVFIGVWAVPRLCELYHGICLTAEERARKNLSQGCRRVPAGTMKIHIIALFATLCELRTNGD